MAKVNKKSVKKVKKISEGVEIGDGWNSRSAKDSVEEEEGFVRPDENITSEEEEEKKDDNDERKRQKLLEAISALGGKRKKKIGERSEAAVHMSEFTVNADGEGVKIDLSDLIGTLDKTPAVPAKTKKQLKNLHQSNITVDCPLSKQDTARIQRDVAFQKAATEVCQWKSIIQQNQRAAQLVFPINQEPNGPQAMEKVVSGWKAQTPLEQEIFALLSANKQPVLDPVLTPTEEASVKAMSLEEAKIRRAELQKVRALQSYYEAKARRERKIKSKKYHKVHNKAKRKEFLKEFDEMVRSDPAAALEELNKMELARMKERMSLKHQNSGKWAKSKAIMAKYDEGARKAMQQQLEVNKELTRKLVNSVNDDEEEEVADPELMPDFVNEPEQGLDSLNPWMRGELSEDHTEGKLSAIVALQEESSRVSANTAEVEEEEMGEETEDAALLREFDCRRKLRQDAETVLSVMDNVQNEAAAQYDSDEGKEDEEDEEGELSKFTSLFKEKANRFGAAVAEQTEAAAVADCMDTSALLTEGLLRVRTLEEMELLSAKESTAEPVPVEPQVSPTTENPLPATQMAGKNKKRKRGIELKEVLTTEAKVILVPLSQTVEDSEDVNETLDQRGLIKEAFAGDDVISDFLKEKRHQEDAGKPKVVDLTLPGWGEWGGTGLKPSRNKRRRFRIKAASPHTRKDQNLPSVIISEKKINAFSLHQVTSLPFPFENHMQFESTIRSPMGRTWNTERTVKKITKPKVVTRLGYIIEPMSREELMKEKKLTSNGNKCNEDSLTIKSVK